MKPPDNTPKAKPNKSDDFTVTYEGPSRAEQEWMRKHCPLCIHGCYFDRCDECGINYWQVSNMVQ